MRKTKRVKVLGSARARSGAEHRPATAVLSVGLAGGLFVLAGGGLIRLRVERGATERWGEERERTAERSGRRTG
ncbi:MULTISPECIES: hypothetical protein [unclassified Streptomyces]|uniref:hypothetical protein n=1 Tax=unclassified Streptomyces TaxID=2593676 RepID=UPI00403C0D12